MQLEAVLETYDQQGIPDEFKYPDLKIEKEIEELKKLATNVYSQTRIKNTILYRTKLYHYLTGKSIKLSKQYSSYQKFNAAKVLGFNIGYKNIIQLIAEDYTTKSNFIEYYERELERRVKYIYELEDNWDEEEAPKIKSETIQITKKFLLVHIKYVFEKFSTRVLIPRITPNVDGTIDILWKNETFRLLINVAEYPQDMISYYGDNYNRHSIEGKIDNTKVDYGIISALVSSFGI